MSKTVENPIDRLVTTKEMAKQLGVAEVTIGRWREKGMPFKRFGPTGRTILFDPDEVHEWAFKQGQQD